MMRMEENVDESLHGLEYETPESTTEAAKDRKFYTINFCFSCSPVYIYWSDDCMDFEELPAVTKSIRVDLEDFNNWEAACEELDGLLMDYPMTYQLRQQLMKFAVDTAKGILVSSGHHLLDLHIPFEITHEHFLDEENDAMDGIVSTRCSKHKVIGSCDNLGRCAICLEDFYKGCGGLCMPCSHVFHGDCIKTWLRTSRCCPLCRFELPTSYLYSM